MQIGSVHLALILVSGSVNEPLVPFDYLVESAGVDVSDNLSMKDSASVLLCKLDTQWTAWAAIFQKWELKNGIGK